MTPSGMHPQSGSWPTQIPQSAGGYNPQTPSGFGMPQAQGAVFGRGYGGYQG